MGQQVYLFIMILMMVVISRSVSVNCRGLPASGSPEAVAEVSRDLGRRLQGKVYTMSSGPSRRGSGH